MWHCVKSLTGIYRRLLWVGRRLRLLHLDWRWSFTYQTALQAAYLVLIWSAAAAGILDEGSGMMFTGLLSIGSGSVTNGPPNAGGNEAEEERQNNCQSNPSRLWQKERTDLSGGGKVLISWGCSGVCRPVIRETWRNLLKLNLTLSTS